MPNYFREKEERENVFKKRNNTNFYTKEEK